jgi:hypothetical protein
LRTIVAIIFCLLIFAAGSARAQGVVLPLPPDDQQMITNQLGSGVVGEALPSKTITDPTVYFPLEGKTLTYHVTAGKNAGNNQQLGVAKIRRPNGKSAWRFELSPSLRGFIHQTAQGDLMMPAVVDSGEGVVIITTPANPFVLNGMKPGETRSYSQQVSVDELDDPSDQEYSGALNGSYTYLGNYQLTVPAGTFDSVLLRIKTEGKVGPAHTTDTAYYFFAPKVGTVAMIIQEDAVAFWLFHIDSTTGKVLMSRS